MHSIGIDIGKRQHVAAVCRAGERAAERRILRFGADRAGLDQLLAWVAREGEVSRVVMESAAITGCRSPAPSAAPGCPSRS